MNSVDKILLRVERFFGAVVGFIVFLTKNLLISSAFVSVLVLAFPAQFLAALESIRPIQSEGFHKATRNLLGVDQRKKPQKKAEGGTDLAEIGFSADGEALREDRIDYAELNQMNERRVASLQEEVNHLRSEVRALKVKYQYGGVDPTGAPVPAAAAAAEQGKQNWSWKGMMGITPKEQGATK